MKRTRKRFPPSSQRRRSAFSCWYPGAHVPMPFVVRNVDADEIHFIQSGEVKFETDAGSLTGERGRLRLPSKIGCLPVRADQRQYAQPDRRESSALQLTPPGPAGMINFARDVHFAEIDREIPPGGTTRLVLKSADGENTTFVLPHDPLAIGEQSTRRCAGLETQSLENSSLGLSAGRRSSQSVPVFARQRHFDVQP